MLKAESKKAGHNNLVMTSSSRKFLITNSVLRRMEVVNNKEVVDKAVKAGLTSLQSTVLHKQ